jgi:ribose transport system substrate-binding protein
MADLVELQVPKEIILASETITKANADKYMRLGF